MDARIERGAKALRDAGARLSKFTGSGPGKGQNKAIMSKLLSVFQSILGILNFEDDETGQRAKSVANNFMGVIQLEIDRRSNDEEIVAVCYSMTAMVFVLRGLHQWQKDNPSEEELDDHLSKMSSTIREFGEFADIYYSRCGSWIVRYKRSTELREMLHEYCENFWNIEDELGRNLVEQFETAQTPAIRTSISTLIDRIGRPSSEAQKQAAAKIVDSRNYLENQEEILKIAEVLHESVTSSIVEAVNADFDTLREESRNRYDMKLRGTTMMLDERMLNEKLLQRMTAGPHDLIEDADIKKIWQDNKWGGAVKCRVFADALSNYYTEEFRKSESPGEDAWTMDVLKKVLYYPAIGEAIDEDASGFISVHELDRFLRKKDSAVTTPVWFAFWAGGPPIINTEYTYLIKEIVSSIEQTLGSIEHPDRELEIRIKGYRDTLDLVRCIVDWNAWDVDGGDDDNNEALVHFAMQVSGSKEELFRKNLEELEYRVDDGDIRFITGEADVRIEQNILILLYVILSKHEDVISAGIGALTGLEFASKYEEMDRTLSTPVWEFYWRYKSLERSWRSQRLDIELQVQSYAGGLFNGWYQEYTKSPSIIVKLLEDPDEDETDENADSIEDKVDKLAERITALDGRLDGIESLLKQIVGRGIAEPAENQQKPAQGNGRLSTGSAPGDDLADNSGGQSGGDGSREEQIETRGMQGEDWTGNSSSQPEYSGGDEGQSDTYDGQTGDSGGQAWGNGNEEYE
ncbi:hypothetical protein B0H11DRAFT_1947559 [Mycena galericulata]|nr:hypothetical protein B0H11DRAFT_1947559 [Mycena galericulata]